MPLRVSITTCLVLSLPFFHATAYAANWTITNNLAKRHFNTPLDEAVLSGALASGISPLESLIKKAKKLLVQNTSGEPINFSIKKALGDSFSTTVKFAQHYQGLEVVGQDAKVHFDRDGVLQGVSGEPITSALRTTPTLSERQGYAVIADRYQQNVLLSDPVALKIMKDFGGKTHLVYHFLTRTTPTHAGQEIYIDAHNGQVVLEFDRATEINTATHRHAEETTPSRGWGITYTADTALAKEHIDSHGYPSDINLSWYKKAVEGGRIHKRAVDRSALNANRSSGLVYKYYKDNFGRRSFDDKDTPVVSVVHIGDKMNNAFWTSEYNLMAYGDGDGEHLGDLTYGIDVTAHELTHGVTGATANLVYAGESGALNESYSDFFGKMVDYQDGDWDIGARIMAQGSKRRALRNMITPEEFRQPGTNDSPLRVPTDGLCTRANDRCGVHTNSGIPNRAAALIVNAIGKEKAEQLYYKVLTTRLSATSNFKDMRRETEQACELMFGKDSTECQGVTTAFDTVKM